MSLYCRHLSNTMRAPAISSLLVSFLLILTEATQKTSNIKLSNMTLKAQTYDPTEGMHNLLLAYAAYQEEADIATWTCVCCKKLPGFQIATVQHHLHLQGYAGYDSSKQKIVLSFRGTNNAMDWVANLNTSLMDYPDQKRVPGGQVHMGFEDAWSVLKPYLLPYIGKLVNAIPGKPVLVTGHSLGGALAQLAALDVKLITSNVEVMTFGSPRWGNPTMAKYFNSQIGTNWRVTNKNDVVPTIPLTHMGFRHTAIQIRYTSDKPLRYDTCDGSGEDDNCEDYIPSINDHLDYMGLGTDCSPKSLVEDRLQM